MASLDELRDIVANRDIVATRQAAMDADPTSVPARRAFADSLSKLAQALGSASHYEEAIRTCSTACYLYRQLRDQQQVTLSRGRIARWSAAAAKLRSAP